jgi:8-oxo-dGTP pyrophosphatase MutT (NUDIX family)
MLFNKLFGIEKLEVDLKINVRNAVRAVIVRDGKILLIHSNRGYYKFPGGGVEGNETDSEALLREITEETGYINCEVQEKLGVVVQRHIDEFDPNSYFQMTSVYYRCELRNEEQGLQQLDGYELDEEFTPKWVVIEEAIRENDEMIRRFEHSGWIQRENYVLKKMLKLMD